MLEMKSRTCENCRYYDEYTNDYGFCDEKEDYVRVDSFCWRWVEKYEDDV